jgi:lycopene cyclase domain-containing protein
MEYLAILMFILLLFSSLKYKYRVRLFASKKEMLTFFAGVLLIGVVWDSFGVLRGHWSLGAQFLIGEGITIGFLPIEEYLFMMIVPFSVLVLYKTHNKGSFQVIQTENPKLIRKRKAYSLMSMLMRLLMVPNEFGVKDGAPRF